MRKALSMADDHGHSPPLVAVLAAAPRTQVKSVAVHRVTRAEHASLVAFGAPALVFSTGSCVVAFMAKPTDAAQAVYAATH